MKQHTGMRPQDIVILLKIIALGRVPFHLKDLAQQLNISQSEVSESVNRSVIAGLMAEDKKTVLRKPLFEFLIHGLPYVFPQKPGAIVPGMATAHSAPPLSFIFSNEELFVWPDAKGTVKGQEIKPLHPGQVEAAKRDDLLYELLALTDALRVGRAREKELAKEELQKLMML
jgi:hypothetical protein